jgi:hypothetical protein
MHRELGLALALLCSAGCGIDVDLGGTFRAEAGSDAWSCPALAPPEADASCQACSHGSPTCQPNGCFNGYMCDIQERDCKDPSSPCPSSENTDAH